MAISGETVTRIGPRTLRVTATSDLGAGVVFYWYLDGAFVGSTSTGSRVFQLEAGDQAAVDVLDSTDPSFDPVANAPAGYPARRILEWTRPPEADVSSYLVEQQRAAEAWTALGVVPQRLEWSHRLLTPRLDDLETYTWRVTPYDAAGNAGTAITIGPELVVRRPDAPGWSLSFDDGAQRITVSAA